MDKYMIEKFENYNVKSYECDLIKQGISKTWKEILDYRLKHPTENKLLKVENFGELYEFGLAFVNKTNKKELGKYYTPEDVADLMSSWFECLNGLNVCDVCCGTGNLILSYFKYIGQENTIELLKNKNVFLYDIDVVALDICVKSIGIIYGNEYIRNIQTCNIDFLDKSIVLPKNSKVISNPPYFKIDKFSEEWEITDVVRSTKEFYSSIMEKIIKQSESSVIITPYSFLGGDKFYSLRKVMNDKNGFIVSFDNVPGNIFNGRKHGIFNTNSTNSVRAAITVTENEAIKKGYKISPLIRFKNEERKNLLQKETLKDVLPDVYQVVDDEKRKYAKVFKQLQLLFTNWNNQSNQIIDDLLDKESDYSLCVPNSCRYFTVATLINLDRTGKHVLKVKTEENMYLIYCLLNSSFAYWHWRLYDGGINYPLGLLKDMPIFFDKMNDYEKKQLIQIAKEMIGLEHKYLVYKKNASELQENVKFPKMYREKINEILCKTLYVDDYSLLDVIHYNFFFDNNDDTSEN